MTLHAVILNWNEARLTLRCLDDLRAAAPSGTVIHVVDNGSRGGDAALIQEGHPGVVLHALPENLGFSKGANLALAAALAAGASGVFFLNNDARVDRAALRLLLEAADRRPECGLYTGKIYADRARNILWSCGVTLGWTPNLARLRGFASLDRGQFDREEELKVVTGCALLVRREVFDKIGLLDPAYFLYVEDADFCARAVAAGFRPLYVPTAVFEHEGSLSTGGGYSPVRKYLCAHGSLTYLRRHGTPGLWLGFLVFDVLLWPLAFLASLARGNPQGALAKARGLRDAFLGRPPDVTRLTGRPLEKRA